MSEINKEGFLNGKLEIVQRSNVYWTCTNRIKAIKVIGTGITHGNRGKTKNIEN